MIICLFYYYNLLCKINNRNLINKQIYCILLEIYSLWWHFFRKEYFCGKKVDFFLFCYGF